MGKAPIGARSTLEDFKAMMAATGITRADVDGVKYTETPDIFYFSFWVSADQVPIVRMYLQEWQEKYEI